MKLNAIIMCLVWLVGVAAPPLAQAGALEEPDLTGGLTLERAINIALERNAGLRSAQQGITVAELGWKSAKRQRFPRVDVGAGYLYSPLEEKRLIPRALLEDLIPLERKFDNQIYSVGATATLPIYTGGRIQAQIEAGKHTKDQAAAQFAQTKDDLIFRVTQAFYRILLLEKLKEANEVTVGNLVESKRIIEKFVEVGKAPRLDLLRIETRLANVRQELIRVNNAIHVADAQLKTLMGVEGFRRRFQLEGVLTFMPVHVDLEESIRMAPEHRPAYQALQEAVAAQEQLVRVIQAERLPQISFRASYQGATGDKEGFPLQDDATVMANLSLPIFDGGVIRTRVAREHAKLRERRSRLEDLKLRILFEVQEAYQNLLEAEERVKNTEVALEAARESIRIEQLKLETGKGIVNDVLDAQADQLKAEVNYAEALADHRVALAALDRATGIVLAQRSNGGEE